MLRTLFVFSIILIGIVYAFQGSFYLLLFYLWNAYFRPEQWMWTDYVSPLKISFVVGVLALGTSITAFRDFKLTALRVLIIGFFLQSIVSLFASEHFDWSYAYWLDFLKVMVIAILITVLVTDRQRYRITLLVIAYSLGLEMAKQGWAQLVLNPGATNNNSSPFLGDNNGVAVGMMMLVPVFVSLAQTSTRRWERYVHQFFIVGLFYRGISTYSRGGLIAAAALGLVTFWRSPKKMRALVSIAVLVTVIYVAMPQQFWTRMQTIATPTAEQDASAQGRLYFWTVAVRMADAKPITGIGFNGFRQSFSTYDTSGGVWGNDRAVHSAWFGVLAEMGYPGLTLLVGVLIVAFLTCWRVRRAARAKPELKDFAAYAGGMQATLVAYAAGVTFLNGQYNEMFWHMIGLTVALAGAYELASQKTDNRVVVPALPLPPRQLQFPRKEVQRA